MTGTPRSYALDPDVVRFLDSLPDGRKRPKPIFKEALCLFQIKNPSPRLFEPTI